MSELKRNHRFMIVIGEDWIHVEYFRSNFKIPFIKPRYNWHGEYGFRFTKDCFWIYWGHDMSYKEYFWRRRGE